MFSHHHLVRVAGWISLGWVLATATILEANADSVTRPIIRPNLPVIPPVRPLPPIIVHPLPVPVEPAGRLAPIEIPNPEVEVVQLRAALPFKNFPLKDPQTGNGDENKAQEVRPEATFTLPNGKQVTAAQFYQDLNQYEKFANDNGHSLREENGQVEVQRIKFDSKLLLAQKDQTLKSLTGADPARLRILDHLVAKDAFEADKIETARILPGLRILPPIRINLPPPTPKTYKGTQSWANSWGSSNKFSAFVNGHVELTGTSEKTAGKAEGNAGGYLFGQKLNFLEGKASYHNPKTGNQEGHIAFYFLGYKIYGKDHVGGAYFEGNAWNKGLDESTQIRFFIGPIPVSAKIGVRGNMELGYNLALLPLRTNADVKPAADSKVYIQVGVDIVVGGVGAGSDLTLLRDELKLGGRLHLQLDPNSKAYYSISFYGHNELLTLKGRVYAYAYIYVPRWGIPPWEKKTWDFTLWQNAGIAANGTIFNISEKVYLF